VTSMTDFVFFIHVNGTWTNGWFVIISIITS
jgi:hypothetical protein